MTRRRIERHWALLMASLAPSAAFATPTPEICPKADIMGKKHSGVTIDTSGSGHEHMIVRTDPDGSVSLSQHGKDHAAVAVQQGRGGTLVIAQTGSSSRAEVSQGGACSVSRISQSGDGNSATIVQNGSGNRTVIRQGKADD